MSYSSSFGTGAVASNPAQYNSISLGTTPFSVVWPTEGYNPANVAASVNDVFPPSSGGSINLPDATQASLGTPIVFNNRGASNVNLNVNDGSANVAVIPPGLALLVYPVDNTTANGAWQSFTLGAGTAANNPTGFAGAGLVGLAATLNLGLAVNEQSVASYNVTEGDRATLIVNTGGAQTISFSQAASSFTENFTVAVKNGGSGVVTLTPFAGDTIDGQSTLTLQSGQSCFILADDAQPGWRTLGLNTPPVLNFQAGSIPVTGGAATLTQAQLNLTIQSFTGTLASNQTVSYNGAVGVWYVTNNTTGAHTLTLLGSSGDTGVQIGQGVSAIVFSTGTAMAIASSSSSGTVTQVNTGTGLSGGPINTSGTIQLANSGVVAGTYGGVLGFASITVNGKGQVTRASTVPSSSVGITLSALTVTGQTFPSGGLYNIGGYANFDIGLFSGAPTINFQSNYFIQFNGLDLDINAGTAGQGQVTMPSYRAYSIGAFGYFEAGAGSYQIGYSASSSNQNISLSVGQGVYAGGFFAFSDRRLKEDVTPISEELALNLLRRVDPVNFTWRETGQETVGLLAQDVLRSRTPRLVGAIPHEGLTQEVDPDGLLSPADAKLVVNYEAVSIYLFAALRNTERRLQEVERLLEEHGIS